MKADQARRPERTDFQEPETLLMMIRTPASRDKTEGGRTARGSASGGGPRSIAAAASAMRLAGGSCQLR